MRFVLALCVVVGCTLCGSAMAGTHRRRVCLLEALLRGIKLLRLHMISMFEPVQQALSATECPMLEGVVAHMKPGMSAKEAWNALRAAEARRGFDALSPSDLEALDALFGQLGESGRDQQELLLNATLDTLGRNLDSARQRNAEADRLYISLGALTGLMIALIVI